MLISGRFTVYTFENPKKPSKGVAFNAGTAILVIIQKSSDGILTNRVALAIPDGENIPDLRGCLATVNPGELITLLTPNGCHIAQIEAQAMWVQTTPSAEP